MLQQLPRARHVTVPAFKLDMRIAIARQNLSRHANRSATLEFNGNYSKLYALYAFEVVHIEGGYLWSVVEVGQDV